MKNKENRRWKLKWFVNLSPLSWEDGADLFYIAKYKYVIPLFKMWLRSTSLCIILIPREAALQTWWAPHSTPGLLQTWRFYWRSRSRPPATPSPTPRVPAIVNLPNPLPPAFLTPQRRGDPSPLTPSWTHPKFWQLCCWTVGGHLVRGGT